MIRNDHGSSKVPAARIVLCNNSSPTRRSEVRCTIGRDLIIKPEVLGRYCVKPLDPLIYDLVLIAGAVAFADRVVARKASVCWRRELDVVVPTSDPEFWKQAIVVRKLTETLELLTGDVWSFQFRPTPKIRNIDAQATLTFEGRRSVVIPFSDGLDSFATALLTTARTPRMELIRVTTVGGRSRRGRRGDHRLSIPVSSSGSRIRRRETSYRSRGFVFGVMAGLAAHLLEADRIVVPESGQGALGPWLNPVGNEAPDVRMHPFFTASLSRFLQTIFGRYINHEHPQIWKTKGETLQDLKHTGLDYQDWSKTGSCPRGRKVVMNNKRVQCGVCASCLLRRQSLLAAGFDEGEEAYFWSNLSAPSLCRAASPSPRETVPNDERQAMCGVYDLAALGNLLRTDFGQKRISNACVELAVHEGAQEADVVRKLRRLLEAHREEWSAFIAAQKSESFLKKWLEMLQC